jgi:hypothetical protein
MLLNTQKQIKRNSEPRNKNKFELLTKIKEGLAANQAIRNLDISLYG